MNTCAKLLMLYAKILVGLFYLCNFAYLCLPNDNACKCEFHACQRDQGLKVRVSAASCLKTLIILSAADMSDG